MKQHSDITRQDVDTWAADLVHKRPRGMSRPDAAQANVVEAIALTPSAVGMFLRLAVKDRPPIDLFVNAGVALALLQAVRIAGTDERWLAADDTLIVAPGP